MAGVVCVEINVMKNATIASKFPTFISPAEVCKLAGISKPTLIKAIKSGQFPQPRRYNQRVLRFRLDEVLEFLNRGAGND